MLYWHRKQCHIIFCLFVSVEARGNLVEVVVLEDFCLALPNSELKAIDLQAMSSLSEERLKGNVAQFNFWYLSALFPSFLETLEEMDSELLKCEFCGKMGYANEFLRSKRFCTMSCAKRYFCALEFSEGQINNHCNETKTVSDSLWASIGVIIWRRVERAILWNYFGIYLLDFALWKLHIHTSKFYFIIFKKQSKYA